MNRDFIASVSNTFPQRRFFFCRRSEYSSSDIPVL